VRTSAVALLLAVIALQTGCVTGRRSFELPPTPQAINGARQGTAFIAAVTDDRLFQNKSSDPSTPSVDGDVARLTPQQKDQMIGRQRNGYGHAMGDISVAGDDSVSRHMRLLVEQGLMRAGYRVGPDAHAPNVATVSVTEFWSWMTPGFATLTFEAKLSCTIAVTNADGVHTLTVKGYGLNHGQFAKDANFQEAFEPAFASFSANFDAAVDQLGLRSDP
jgi:uncharacterized lipoprotein YajG